MKPFGLPGSRSLCATLFSPLPYSLGARGFTSCHGFLIVKISFTMPSIVGFGATGS